MSVKSSSRGPKAVTLIGLVVGALGIGDRFKTYSQGLRQRLGVAGG
jgi:hypothetical protein